MRLARLRFLPSLVLAVCGAVSLAGQPLSKEQPISFYHKNAARDLTGLAVRSDGRIIPGPIVRPLAGHAIADLWWDWESGPTAGTGWVGTGPDGHILAVTIDASAGVYTSEIWAETDTSHIFALQRLPDGRLLAGGNPRAALYLYTDDGTPLQHAELAADSVLDIALSPDRTIAWVATGSPALLYRVDLAQFTAAAEDAPLADRGITRHGAVRDRNLRRLTVDAAGRVLAGSAPSANLYRFTSDTPSPLTLMDRDDGEITDLYFTPSGDLYVAVVDATSTTRHRTIQSTEVETSPPEEESDQSRRPEPDPAPSIMEAPPVETFSGRSELLVLPGGEGLPEVVSSRQNLAFYGIVPFDGGLLLPGGDDGELAGYDPEAHRALTFAASQAAQLNDMVPGPLPGTYIAITNNPAGITLVDFNRAGPRRIQTEAIDLQSPSTLGALRFNRLRELAPKDITVEMRANRGRDAVEGWTPWTPATYADGGWTSPGLTGRMVQIALTLPESLSPEAQLDQATLYFLPQNRRPVLRSFRLISPNFALQPRSASSPASGSRTLGQIVGNSPGSTGDPANSERKALMASPVVPEPGAQIVLWTVTDPDGDHLQATFAVRHEDENTWTELLRDSDQDWLQFDRRTLREGTYFTRLVVRETAPRPVADRREAVFATDDLVIDLSPPEISSVDSTRQPDSWDFQISAHDRVSLLTGVRLVFNNGYTASTAQPVDGILDTPRETFPLTIPAALIATATAVEVYVEDAAANVAVQRHALTSP